jgi:hypothetical protein
MMADATTGGSEDALDSKRPAPLRKYGVAVVPTIVAVPADGTVVERPAA